MSSDGVGPPTARDRRAVRQALPAGREMVLSDDQRPGSSGRPGPGRVPEGSSISVFVQGSLAFLDVALRDRAQRDEEPDQGRGAAGRGRRESSPSWPTFLPAPRSRPTPRSGKRRFGASSTRPWTRPSGSSSRCTSERGAPRRGHAPSRPAQRKRRQGLCRQRPPEARAGSAAWPAARRRIVSSDDRSGQGRRDLDAALAPREQCIAVERLAGELDGKEREHVASCARCRTELALYRDFESDAASAEERAASEWIVARLRRGRAGASAFPRRWSFGLAAAALLTLGIGLLTRNPEPESARASGGFELSIDRAAARLSQGGSRVSAECSRVGTRPRGRPI